MPITPSWQGDEPGPVQVLHQVVEREGAEHGELAVGEVDHAHDAEQQREAERDQDVDRAQADAVDQDLSEDRDIQHRTVIPGLVPGIQPSVRAGETGKVDSGDEHRDDTLDGSSRVKTGRDATV